VFRWTRNDFIDALATSDIWVAEIDDVIVGFIIGQVKKKSAYIDTVDVDPEKRGLGIATQLMAKAECEWRAAGVETVELEVHIDNPAQTLYFKRGYRVTGLKHKYYPDGSTAISMAKSLPLKTKPPS
jgi:ribosomal-protein-alanine N-acetyltransferase